MLKPATLLLCAALMIALAPALVAQGTSRPPENATTGTQPAPAATSQATSDPADDEWVTHGELKKLLEERGSDQKDREGRGVVTSVGGVDICLGASIEVEVRKGQESRGGGRRRAAHASPSGLDLDEALFTVEAHYDEQTSFTDYELLRGRMSFGWERDELRVQEAYAWFNRPLSRFAIPGFKDAFVDSLLAGLAKLFFANGHRVSESHSLAGEALWRDERMQLTWTVASKRWYLIAGISGGTALASDGEVDESRNFPLLQDDRDAWFTQVEQDGQGRMELMAGAGWVADLGGHGDVVARKIPFSPNQVSMQRDVLHIGVWLTEDQLAASESVLLAATTGRGEVGATKRRYGVNADLVLGFGAQHVWYAHAEFARAEDGSLTRDFYGIESSVAIDMGDAMPILLVTQPFARFNVMTVDGAQRIAGPAPASGSAQWMADWAGGERMQLTCGVRLAMHRQVSLAIEYTWNRESLSGRSTGESSVSNNLWLANLRVVF